MLLAIETEASSYDNIVVIRWAVNFATLMSSIDQRSYHQFWFIRAASYNELETTLTLGIYCCVTYKIERIGLLCLYPVLYLCIPYVAPSIASFNETKAKKEHVNENERRSAKISGNQLA